MKLGKPEAYQSGTIQISGNGRPKGHSYGPLNVGLWDNGDDGFCSAFYIVDKGACTYLDFGELFSLILGVLQK